MTRLVAALGRTQFGSLARKVVKDLHEHDVDVPLEWTITERFWISQGVHYMQDQADVPEWKKKAFLLQEVALVEFLRGLAFESVLEVGCGYGRILRLINEKFKVQLTGVDISDEQLGKAGAYLNDSAVELYQRRAANLLFPNGAFGLVLTCNVLLHIPPRKLDTVLKEIVRVSRRHVVFVEPVKGDNGYFRKPYCWDHDYEGRLRELGLVEIRHARIPMPSTAPENEHNRIVHGTK